MTTIIDQDLLSIQEARILAENAAAAHKAMAELSQEQLDVIVDRMAEEIGKYAKELAEQSSDETGYGNWQDKYLKNRFVCEYMSSKLKGMRCVGVISKNERAHTAEIGVPVGVIAAVVPATNPVSTTIYKTLIAVKSGNAIIFAPHPRARKTIGRVLDIMIAIAESNGLPEGALSYLHTVTKPGTKTLLKHDAVSMILITGVPKMLKPASQTGKPVLYGSAGNGPAFIERTADIEQAVEDIIRSKTFDNGVGAASEQSLVVDAPVAGQVRNELQRNGAYFMSAQESDKLGKLLFRDGKADPEMIGKTAVYLARRAGFAVPEGTRLLISEQEYVSNDNPYAKEKLCPVLAFYVEEDWQDACEKCIELLINERKAHTLVIHSRDEMVVEQFALKKPVARVLVNTPAAFGGMGLTTNLFPALTLGGGITGKGFTSDNVSPMNLIYIRRVALGVRSIDDVLKAHPDQFGEMPQVAGASEADDIKLIRSMVEQLLTRA